MNSIPVLYVTPHCHRPIHSIKRTKKPFHSRNNRFLLGKRRQWNGQIKQILPRNPRNDAMRNIGQCRNTRPHEHFKITKANPSWPQSHYLSRNMNSPQLRERKLSLLLLVFRVESLSHKPISKPDVHRQVPTSQNQHLACGSRGSQHLHPVPLYADNPLSKNKHLPASPSATRLAWGRACR